MQSSLNLAFSRSCVRSSSSLNVKKPRPAKCVNLHSNSSTSLPLAQKVILLQMKYPRAARVIEHLIDDALERLAI